MIVGGIEIIGRTMVSENNMVTDVLAKNSIVHDLGLNIFGEVPIHAAQALLGDLATKA